MANFDLKIFRENVLKETQEAFALRLGVNQDYISKLEKNPDSIPIDLLYKLARSTGMTLDQLVGYKKPECTPFLISDTREKIRLYKESIFKYLESKTAQSMGIDQEELDKAKKQIISLLKETTKKPVVGAFGMSDAGKSCLINVLLGMEKMPVNWTPTTTISIYIKHISDRPSFITEEVWVFKSEVNEEKCWNPQKLYDEDYCKRWKLAGGTTDILRNYGTREGGNAEDAGSAVVFLDSDILKLCDLVDLPGFGTGDRDSDEYLPETVRQQVDIVLYLSLANGFLKGADIAFLEKTLKDLKPLETRTNGLQPLNNLFILASQAHTVNMGNDAELKTILKKGSQRLYNRFPEIFWDGRTALTGKAHSYEDLNNRFFTYTTDIPQLRKKFETELGQLLEKLSRLTEERVAQEMKKMVSDKLEYFAKWIDAYNQREKMRIEYEQLTANEADRIDKNIKMVKEVQRNIFLLQNESKQEFIKFYNETINIEHIVNVINNRGFTRKKSDLEDLNAYINNELDFQNRKIMGTKCETLNKVVQQYIENFEKLFTGNKIDLKKVTIPFDTIGTFVGGLASITTFGGLALWASTLGNLGAYIIVAKGVSLLSAIGISVGGTAAAASAVAAIGGPVVLGIALAGIIGATTWTMVTGSWKKTIAKKIVESYAEQNACDKYLEVIDKFWRNTSQEFDAASSNLDREFGEYLKGFKKILNEIEELLSKEELLSNVESVKFMKALFEEMPLLD